MYMMMKHLHMTAVVLSVLLFVLRFIWKQMNAPIMQRKWVKVVPHIIDTVLLASAITLCILIAQYPFVHGWVTAKVLGVVTYIVLGFGALKWAHSKGMQWGAFVLALATIVFTFKVAITKQPLLF
ncbi:SirB2 family protein [Alteromonas sp. ASW11-36]|uniref:SirB2 family protein n=1 Tax=Alteromonas arenosi TaxID=3055817 RepID=A0ABT7SYD0_9ALTE|nr:SirB2 family protein [Alteromonas sp. ASW11-36]MDM7861187.1 SirB2 family protein [Alteromonas sp. ASW11-36]